MQLVWEVTNKYKFLACWEIFHDFFGSLQIFFKIIFKITFF